MKRREFLKSSLIFGAVGALPSLATAEERTRAAAGNREFYELRTYRLQKGAMQKRFEDYCRDAAIPATNRAGVGPVGVFNVVAGPDSTTAYVLLPYKSMDAFLNLPEQLHADAAYQKAGAEFINASAANPPYLRIESSLMHAFEGMPKLEVPALTAEKKARLFELRTYESHSKKGNQKKIEMFNQGEIGIFRRTGLMPVFFGETLIGSRLPNLTYMIVFENMAERESKWAVFRADEEWVKLKSKPEYSDPEIVSNTSNIFLRPAAYSQI
jgi:hypothetical protein